MIDSHGGLAIAVIIFYSNGIWPAGYVCFKHGFRRTAGWLYLFTLAIVRLVGSICEVVLEQQSKPSTGLAEVVAICNGIGLVPLLFCLVGLLERVNNGMAHGLPSPLFRITRIVIVTGLALSVYGIIEAMPGKSASTQHTGEAMRKTGILLLLFVFIVASVVALLTLLRAKQARHGDRLLVISCVATLPFVLTRIVYSLCVAFATHSTVFNAIEPNVYAQAFMQILMECLAWIILLVAGLKIPAMEQDSERACDVDSKILPRSDQRQFEALA